MFVPILLNQPGRVRKMKNSGLAARYASIRHHLMPISLSDLSVSTWTMVFYSRLIRKREKKPCKLLNMRLKKTLKKPDKEKLPLISYWKILKIKERNSSSRLRKMLEESKISPQFWLPVLTVIIAELPVRFVTVVSVSLNHQHSNWRQINTSAVHLRKVR